MVQILVAFFRGRSKDIVELGGATAVVYGVSLLAIWAMWLAIGAFLLLKSFELDLRGGGDGQ